MQCFYIFISKIVSDNISIAKVRKYGQCDNVLVREGYKAYEKHCDAISHGQLCSVIGFQHTTISLLNI